ncbi:transcriptional regulator [Microvirga tunisiensis]|uniref:Transcriptional regulator n=1 Tax=Pannonibacter tanglangensis TaxID=2750084 RepID=A0A7X5EZ35_9HYPH|nr:helix-turn-helix domain-containing protein [Pannonibacter sp. XCT-53]NBN76777.1 transcriptional regulator [Pannonibacter sp. XCT-53]
MKQPRKWDRHSIKAELHRQGMTIAALERLNEAAPGSFGHVWNRTVRRAEQAIAEYLNVEVSELWPDRYPVRSSRILSAVNEARLARREGQARDAA